MSYLLIDGNSLGYAAQNSPSLTANDMPVQAIFYCLQMIKNAIRKNPEYVAPIVLWDGHAQFRYDLLPTYKGDRGKDERSKQMRDEFKVQRPEIIKALELLGIAQIHPENFEADDIAGFLVRRATESTKKSLLVSGDRDWLQLVNALTSWYDPRSTGTSVIGKSEFRAFTGFQNPKQFIQGKAILGDKSDSIDGVPGLGEKASVSIMDHFGSVSALVKNYREHGPFADRKVIKDGESSTHASDIPSSLSRFRKKLDALCGEKEVLKTFVNNIKLMDLTDPSRDEEIKEDCKIVRSRRDHDGFLDFCGHHKFASIIRNQNEWIF